MENKNELTFMGLCQIIEGYESDTFSATESEITNEEIRRVAYRCLNWLVENRLDGVMLDNFLADIRELE